MIATGVPAQWRRQAEAGKRTICGDIVSQSGGVLRRANRVLSLEPTAAVGNPPTDEANWNRSAQCPPERKNEISHETQDNDRGPEDFPLHAPSLRQTGSWCPSPERNIG